MKNSENAFKIVSAETQYIPVSFKKKKSHKFITRHTVKHLVQKELFLLFLYTKHAYDILSKKFIEDSVPITTTPETLKKAGILAENIHEMFSLHEVLTMTAPSDSNISTSGLSFCEGDTLSKHHNISDFVPVRMSP